jgi:hypothetical protein
MLRSEQMRPAVAWGFLNSNPGHCHGGSLSSRPETGRFEALEPGRRAAQRQRRRATGRRVLARRGATRGSSHEHCNLPVGVSHLRLLS